VFVERLKNPLAIAFGAAVLVVLALIGGLLFVQRGAHLELQGKVLKVRTAALDENNSVLIADFRITNSADYPFQVQTVTVTVEDQGGAKTDGMTISESDARHLMEVMPLLGQKYSPSLIVRNKIPPHATEDRMIAASFPIPAAALEKRKSLIIRVDEVDGVVSTIKEN
jgi:hypothetical protein